MTLGGSYDFDVAKVYLGVQYFDEVDGDDFSGVINDVDGAPTVGMIKGYGVSLTADAPVAGGKAMFGIGYMDAEAADSENTDFDLTRYVVSVGYSYPFSKRTDVYAAASYMQDKYEQGTTEVEPSAYGLYVGLRHLF